MSEVNFEKSAIDKLMSDPKIQDWQQDMSRRKVPFLGYYRRSYSTAPDGTITEYGDGFMLTTIDPKDQEETRDIVIKSVSIADECDILVGGEKEIMSRNFAIGWKNKYTYEPQASS